MSLVIVRGCHPQHLIIHADFIVNLLFCCLSHVLGYLASRPLLWAGLSYCGLVTAPDLPYSSVHAPLFVPAVYLPAEVSWHLISVDSRQAASVATYVLLPKQ